MTWEPEWTGWCRRRGQCTPMPGEALLTYECAHCSREITAESDPDRHCLKAPKVAEGQGEPCEPTNPLSPHQITKE